MKESELYVAKEYKFNNPNFSDIDYIIDNCDEPFHNKYFHTFKPRYDVEINITDITNNENFNLVISTYTMNLHTLNKEIEYLKNEEGLIFNHMNKLTIKFYSHIRYINIKYYLKIPMSMCHRRFFKQIANNRDYVENFCNDEENPLHLACQKGYYDNQKIELQITIFRLCINHLIPC